MAKRRKPDTEKVKVTRESFRKAKRVFRYIKPYRGEYFLSLVFLILTSVLFMGFPLLMGKLFGSSFESPQDFKLTNLNDANSVILLLLILFGGQALFSFFRIYFGNRVVENALTDLRRDAFKKLVGMPMHFFNTNKVGELTSRVSADAALLQETLSITLTEFIRQFIVIIGGVVALALISLKLSLIMLATIPVLALVAVFFGRYIQKMSKSAQDELAKANHVVEESLMGIVNVKSYSNEWLEYNRYAKATDTYRKLALKSTVWRGVFVSFIIFFLFGAIAFIIWQGVRLTDTGELAMPDLISFILFTVFLGGSFASIPELYSSLQKAIGGTERLMDILEEKPEVFNFTKPEEKLKLKGDVSFNNVHFHYASRPDVEVLKGINFHASPGQQIALVGSSGSGKSTLMSLLLRFYQPVSGNILVDGKEISSYDLTEYRSQVAFVPQEVILFGGTIRENIVYGKPDANDDEIWLAAEKANAADFIRSFPEGLDTLVGDRGIQLSGGQKQRVSIARAVLRDPSILFLDEATSSLDSESEKLVQDALEKLMKGRTSFVIAHRLSTIRNADMILVLENGVIRETGNHGELVQKENGIYKKLSSLQFVYQ